MAGLTTSRHWVLRDSTNSPLMRSLTLGTLEEVIYGSCLLLLGRKSPLGVVGRVVGSGFGGGAGMPAPEVSL
ncbi:hypothetical protein D3C76_1764830 [compost metagenome]